MEEGHQQILKYKKSIVGNRALIVKAFATLFFFIILFGTVMR